MVDRVTRRRYLAGIGVAGVAATAGCLDDATDQTGGGGDTDDEGESPASDTPPIPDFGGYLDDARGYSGGVVDARG